MGKLPDGWLMAGGGLQISHRGLCPGFSAFQVFGYSGAMECILDLCGQRWKQRGEKELAFFLQPSPRRLRPHLAQSPLIRVDPCLSVVQLRHSN